MISYAQQRGGAIKAIQRGVTSLANGTVNVTIAAVNQAYTELRYLGVYGPGGFAGPTGSGTDMNSMGGSVRLISATQLAVSLCGSASHLQTVNVSWELTEYYPT